METVKSHHQIAHTMVNLRTLWFAQRDEGREGTCYLAGPMTGLPEFNRHAFVTCADKLRKCGWKVFSPVENDEADGVELEGTTGSEKLDYRRAMAWDLHKVCTADCVIVMPGWEHSKGCRLEVYVALEVGTPVYTYLNQRSITEIPEREANFSSQVAVADLGVTGAAPPSSVFGLPEATSEGEGVAHTDESPVPVPSPVPSWHYETFNPSLRQTTVSEDSAARKALPVTTGVIDYFPAALVAVAAVSKYGNDKHNPGEPLHHARGKSMDHADAIGRHLIDRGKMDSGTGLRHSAELAWRALALLQQELEDAGEAPLARGATL